MFTRLTREQPWTAQIGCAFAVSLIVAAPGIFVGYMTWFHDTSRNRTMMFVFAAVWIAVGLIVLMSSVVQAIAVRSPETLVEIDPPELTPGEPVRIRIIQPGPLRLKSLHANLAGEEMTYKISGGAEKRTRMTRYLGPFRMLDIGRQNVDLSETLQRENTFVVPDI